MTFEAEEGVRKAYAALQQRHSVAGTHGRASQKNDRAQRKDFEAAGRNQFTQTGRQPVMEKLIDRANQVRQWNDDMKRLRESASPMATRLSFWQRLIRSHIKRSRAMSSVGRAIFQHRAAGHE